MLVVFITLNDFDLETLKDTVAALTQPLSEAYDSTFGLIPAKKKKLYMEEIALAVAQFKQPDHCAQTIGDFCVLYECAFQADPINRNIIADLAPHLPFGAMLVVEAMKNPNHAIASDPLLSLLQPLSLLLSPSLSRPLSLSLFLFGKGYHNHTHSTHTLIFLWGLYFFGIF